MPNPAATTSRYDLIVIGAGPAGCAAALAAAQRGKRVLLATTAPLGGTCLHAGCIPTKTLLHTARLYREIQSGAASGLTGAAAVTLDWNALQQHRQAVITKLTAGLTASLKKENLTLALSPTPFHFLPPPDGAGYFVAGNDEIYGAAQVLLATGSLPAAPPIPGWENALDSSAALALPALPSRVTIIGGGVIGLELATIYSTFGAAVTLIEALPQIGGVLDGEIAKRLLQALKKRGITFFLNSRVTSLTRGAVNFTTADGAAQTQTSEIIIGAVGRMPQLDALKLDAVGVQHSRHGVTVDARGRTTAAGIWAAGDVTGKCLLAHAAARDAEIAVANLCGAAVEGDYRVVPAVVYTAPEVAMVGASEEKLIAAKIAYRKVSTPWSVAGRYAIEYPDENGLFKVLLAADGKILGVHILGGNGGELIHTVAMLMQWNFDAAKLAEVIFPHPALAEALKIALCRGT